LLLETISAISLLLNYKNIKTFDIAEENRKSNQPITIVQRQYKFNENK